MAVAILGALRDAGTGLVHAIRYQPVEVDPRRVAALHYHVSGVGIGDVVEPAGRHADHRDRPRQRGPRRAPGPSRRPARERTARGPRRPGRHAVHRCRRGAIDARPVRPARRRGHQPGRRPARGGLPRPRRVGGRGRRRSRQGRPAPHRLRLSRRRAVRPGPTSRRHAPGVRPPYRPRRSVRPRRAPGPDRARRRGCGRAGGGGSRPDPPRDHDPGGVPRRPRDGRATAAGDPDRPVDDDGVVPRRPLRRSCACSTPRRPAASGSWPSGATGPRTTMAHPSPCPASTTARTGADAADPRSIHARTTRSRLGHVPYCGRFDRTATLRLAATCGQPAGERGVDWHARSVRPAPRPPLHALTTLDAAARHARRRRPARLATVVPLIE